MTEEAATKVKGRRRAHAKISYMTAAHHILPIEPHARKRSRWQAWASEFTHLSLDRGTARSGEKLAIFG
jgi:hypothetical protein